MGAMQLRGRPRGINIPRLAVRAVGEGSRSLWGVIHGSVLFQQHLYESVRTIQSQAGSQHKEVSEATVENSWSPCLLEEDGDEAAWGADGAGLENADFASDLLSLGPGQQGLPAFFRVFVTPSPSKRPISYIPVKPWQQKGHQGLHPSWGGTETLNSKDASVLQGLGIKSRDLKVPKDQSQDLAMTSPFHQRTSGVQGPCGWVSLGYHRAPGPQESIGWVPWDTTAALT